MGDKGTVDKADPNAALDGETCKFIIKI